MSSDAKMTLDDVLATAIDRRLSQVHTAIPGRVESYSQGKAEVSPAIAPKMVNGEYKRYPRIPNVPVIFPRTGDTIIHYPISSGDYGLILFSERSLDVWLYGGGIADTDGGRMMHITDAIFLPGLFPFRGGPSWGVPGASDSSLYVKHHNGTLEITSSGQVKINGSHLTVDPSI